MRISPLKLKSLTLGVIERGRNELSAKIKAAQRSAQVKKLAASAWDHYRKIPTSVKRDLCFAQYTSREEIAKVIAKGKFAHLQTRWNESVRSEVLALAMESKDEAEFMRKYKKINPFVSK